MDLSAARQGHEVSGSGGGGDVSPPLPEYLHLVHFHSSNNGAMSSSREMARGAGVNDIVGTGQNGTETGWV